MDYYKLINDIDYIKTESIVSEMYVIEALSNNYNKESCILEYDSNMNNQYRIVQEGEVLDKVKKESKNDKNKLITIIKFIPRLIKAFIETLKPDKKKKDKFKKVKDNLKKFDSLPQAKKEQKVAELNERFKGQHEFYIDKETGKIKIKNNMKNIIETIWSSYLFLKNTYDLVKEIKTQLDPLNPGSVNKFVDKCDNVIHIHKNGNEVPGNEIVDLIDSGLSGTADVVSICSKIAAEILSVIGVIHTASDKILTHEVIKDMPNEKVVKLTEGLSKLTAKISKINILVSGVLGNIDVVTGLLNSITDTGAPIVKKAILIRNTASVRASEEAINKFGDAYNSEEGIAFSDKREKEIISELIKEEKEKKKQKEKETEEKIKQMKILKEYIKEARSMDGYNGTNERKCLVIVLKEYEDKKKITSEDYDRLMALYNEQHDSKKNN